MEKDPENRFEIIRLGGRGDGVAANGVFAAGMLPGEVIEGAVVDGRIAKPKIVTPSANRIRPLCAHAKGCGGCALQHASEEFVASWKREEVVRALSLAGIETDVRKTITSPTKSRRRAALSGRRLKSGSIVGFHARASDSVVPIPDCQLLDPALAEVIPALEKIVDAGGSRRGEITFHVTSTRTGVDVMAEGGRDMDVGLFQTLGGIANGAGLARLTWNGEVVVMLRPPEADIDGVHVPIPPGAFLQATVSGQATLIELVKEILGGHKAILDLFSGAGTFSFPLAKGADVHSVEGSRELLEALDQGKRYSVGLRDITTQTRDLFRNPLLPEEMTKCPGVVIDPPRAGAAAQVQQLAASDVKTIAFVSCNPATFARDARILIDGGYSLQWVQPVDQFRWATHIELVGSFSRDLS